MYSVLPKHIENPDPEIYLSDNYLVLDAETTGIEYGTATNKDNNLLLFVAGRRGKYQSYRGNELDMQELLDRIEKVDFIVMQNAKFDLQWLKRCGIDLTQVIVYDTLLGKYIHWGNQPWKPKNLNSLAKEYDLKEEKDNVVNIMIKQGICPSLIPFSWLNEYCIQDVRLTENIFLKQRIELNTLKILPVLYTRCLFTVVLTDIEFNGMCLDEELVEEEYYRKVAEKVVLDTSMEKITGGINTSSPQQVSDFLFKVLDFPPPMKNKKVLWNKAGTHHPAGKEIIAELRPKTKKQKDFLALKGRLGSVVAAITKNLEFFRGVCKERGGIFYAQFNQSITKTQRLSSSGRPIQFDLYDKPKSVQFQNLPRVYKPMFKAREEGWYIGEVDQAQLEFRVAGFLGGDKQIYSDVINKEDIHRFTASVLNNIPESEVTKEQRTAAKADTFKPAFGGERGTPEQEKYYKAFREKYHMLQATQEKWCQTVAKEKRLKLPTNTVVHWPDTKVNKFGYNNNRHKIYNLPIQHLATAEIVPIGVVYQWHRMKAEGMKSFLVNTVHDSSIGEVHPEEKDFYAEIGSYAFVEDTLNYLKVVYDIDFDMPLEAEADFGKWWATGEDEDGNPYNPLAKKEM